MNLSERTREALNEQMMREIGASYLYLSMAGYCDSIGFDGFGQWMHRQSSEEWDHAMRFRTYLEDRGARVDFGAIDKPEKNFSSMLEIFERALESEESVSAAIADLYAVARDEKDLATQTFLDWFVTEQVEEEKSVKVIIDWLKRIGDTDAGLYLMDQQLGGGISAASADSGSAQAE
ncbi:MAG: ferritin [Actinomycetota bacterium]